MNIEYRIWCCTYKCCGCGGESVKHFPAPDEPPRVAYTRCCTTYKSLLVKQEEVECPEWELISRVYGGKAED